MNSLMNKLWLGFFCAISLASLSFISACGNDSSPSDAKVEAKVESTDDLPNCTKKREGESMVVEENNSTYACHDGQWNFVSAPIPSVETLDELSNCTKRIQDDTIKVVSEKAIFRCNDGDWEKIRVLTDTLESIDDLLACVSKREGNVAYISNEHALYECMDKVWTKTVSFMDTVSVIEDLPNCSSKNVGDSSYVQNEKSVYICAEKKWHYLGHVFDDEDALPNCTEKRNDQQAYLIEEHESLICSDGKWYRYNIYSVLEHEKSVSSSSENSSENKWDDYYPVLSSSSAKNKKESSSSVKANGKSSSSSKEQSGTTNSSSSSSKKEKDSSSSVKANGKSSSSSKEQSGTTNSSSSSSKKEKDSSSSVKANGKSSSSSKEQSGTTNSSSSSSKKEKDSSSSVKTNGKSSSSSKIVSKYDCSVYNCVTTKYLNQKMLAAGKYGELLDTRDNQVYRTVKIGSQTWIAQNLNYLPATGTTYCYDGIDSYCSKYGRLYVRAAVSCPVGWHLPSDGEWEDLFKAVGGKSVAGAKLRATSGWDEHPDMDNADEFGFSALPSGVYHFGDEGNTGWYLSATDHNDYAIGCGDAISKSTAADYTAISVRCLKDNASLTSSSSVQSSSSAAKVSSKYDCSVYNCVTTEYLNQDMLAAGKYGELLDTRDNKVYRTVDIGTQTWMAQSLSYNLKGSICDGDDSKCIVGRMYVWTQVMNFDTLYTDMDASSKIKAVHQGLCPDGYHVPTNAEFQTLYNYVLKNISATSVTTELNSSYGWAAKTSDDAFGFAMLPGNALGKGDGRAAFWTASQVSSIRAYRWFKDYGKNPFSGYTFSNAISDEKFRELQLRCVKD